jgi:hypothetical protein
MGKPHLIITSIQAPNRVMRAYAEQCGQHGFDFIVIGDTKSPRDFRIDGCRFVAVDDPVHDDFAFARVCPTAHYARKNIGYLLAMAAGAPLIVETDDDNAPRAKFWEPRRPHHTVPCLDGGDWINAYRYFTDVLIWPRGLPLDAVHRRVPDIAVLPMADVECPIQQGLADGDPDVDAVYRLVLPLPQSFRAGVKIALGDGAWCPFNSQNTAWWPDAYPLLYLPSLCSFRMTDIWRSLVAQRIAWVNGWRVLFHSPTVFQDRNEHDLMQDFEQEVPGYLRNARIAKALTKLDIEPGADRLFHNLHVCYSALSEHGIVDPGELSLLDAWISDCNRLAPRSESFQ